jgi:hypothetical protein
VVDIGTTTRLLQKHSTAKTVLTVGTYGFAVDYFSGRQKGLPGLPTSVSTGKVPVFGARITFWITFLVFSRSFA